MIIAPNSTDVSVYFKLVDPTAGTPETALVITALNAVYTRDRADAVTTALTALAFPTTVHTDNYGIEVSAASAPGLYRVDFPDAAFAAGVARVQLGVVGAAIDPAYIEVELLPWLTPITGATVRAVDAADAALAIPGSLMGLADDAITLSKFDEATAFPLVATDAGATRVARVGADSDTLETLSDQLDAVALNSDMATLLTRITEAVAHDTDVQTLLSRLSAARGGYLDNLNSGVPLSAVALAAIWAYVTRTLTYASAEVAASVTDEVITAIRGDTLVISVTNLGSLASRTKIWFALKRQESDGDSASLLFVEETDGLVYLNGAAAADKTKGTLVVTDTALGNLTITVQATEMATLPSFSGAKFDIQKMVGSVVTTLRRGTFNLEADITRATT